MMNTTNSDMGINIVRLSRGIEFERYEIALGCSVASFHDSRGRSSVVSLDEARARISERLVEGWAVAAV